MTSSKMLRRMSAAIVLLFPVAAGAQQLTYKPINPTFGGDPFNSSHLLAVATAQNKYKERTPPQASQSQADLFASQLQSRLLSALAGQVTDAIFGENPQDHGTFTFGNQSVSFVRSLDSVELTITDTSTGGVTQITIPTFVKVP